MNSGSTVQALQGHLVQWISLLKFAELAENTLWFNGPSWLINPPVIGDDITQMPKECSLELKAKERELLSLLAIEECGLSQIINLKNYSDLHQLYRITSYVLNFIQKLKQSFPESSPHCLKDQSEIMWIKECQKLT